jgi:hypothetical protein
LGIEVMLWHLGASGVNRGVTIEPGSTIPEAIGR